MSKARRRIILALSTVVALLVALWLWNEFALIRETASPDEFDLGTVYMGARVEFSAKFLVPSGKHPFDALFERVVRWFPKSWQPALSRVHPKNFRHDQGPVDLAALKPVARTPPHIRITKLTPEQRKEWYKGSPFVIANMTLNTERPGKFMRPVRVTMGRRTASLLVKVNVVAPPAKQLRLLIASTPYEAYTTEHGSVFREVTAVLSAAPLTADYLEELPTNLMPYQVILLADAALVRLNEDDYRRLRDFVDRGGHLRFACDAFMSGSVPAANRLLTKYGLQMADRDFGQVGEMIVVTNLITDPLSLGVERLVFHRPALITVAPESSAKAVALAPGGQGAFVAVSRMTNGGEVAVLSSSLWWWWVHQFSTNSNNSRLLGNLLAPAGTNPAP